MRIDAGRLYREHSDSLFRYLVRMTGDADVAADVLHDTFERLMRTPPKDGANPRGWLFRVATNLLRDGARRSARHLRLVELAGRSAHSDAAPSPERGVLAHEARGRAERLLASLSERDRAILLMREEGFTHREIADAVGTTTKSVGTLIARALDRVIERAAVEKRA